MAFVKKYFVHESSYIDENVEIGIGSRIWHFSHLQSGVKTGNNTTIGQNVNISFNVEYIGSNVKIPKQVVSTCEGVEIEDYVFCESFNSISICYLVPRCRISSKRN